PERRRIALPGPELRPVEGQQAEHVDDHRPADQLDGAGGDQSPVVGEEAEPPPVDHGAGDQASPGEGSSPQKLTTIVQRPNTSCLLGKVYTLPPAERQ